MADDIDDPTPAIWQHEFTVENLIDYARAARDLSAYMRVLDEEGFKNLVLPSRGAMPFLRAARSAYMTDSRSLPTAEARIKRKFEEINSPFMRKLILPFSADPTEQTQTSGAIREYWSRVLAAIVRRDGHDPYLGFYKVLVEKFAKRSWLNALDRDLPTEKFIFVDTVISGRAICEILASFDKVGLDQCHFILIADANGTKIEPRYRRVIDDLISARRCDLIHVNRLFTEDRGPGASGVWSTVYPQVLDSARQAFGWAQHCYGAGTFYHLVSTSQVELEDGIGQADYNMPVTQMHASITTAIFSAVSALQEIDQAEEELAKVVGLQLPGFESLVAGRRAGIEERMRRSLEYLLRDMRDSLDELGAYTPLDKRTTKILAEPRVTALHPNAQVDVSSSHLVRVRLPKAEIAAFIREAKQELAAGQDVLADDWFR